MKRSERGEVATILTIGTLIVIGVTAVASSLFVNQSRTTSSKAAESCAAMAENRTGAHPGKAGTDKKDKTDACNPACCEWEGQCPNGQKCDIPNGYCKSGFSCNPDTSQERVCVNNQCVMQPCGKNTTPCGQRTACTSDPQCQSASNSSSSSSSSQGPVGGECFNLSTHVYADPSGADWKFNTHVRVFSPPEGKDGHIQLWVNGNSKGWNQPWNKGVNNPFDIEPQYTDSPTLSKGQSKTMTYKVKVDECAPLGNEYQISCTYSVNANNQPVVEGGGCTCSSGNCGSATPPSSSSSSSSKKSSSSSSKSSSSTTSKSTPPNTQCIDMEGKCTAQACRLASEGQQGWVCTNDDNWCCPPGGATTACTGKTPIRCDSTTGICKNKGGGGNTEYYIDVSPKYYSGNNCTDITSSIISYCGCGTAQGALTCRTSNGQTIPRDGHIHCIPSISDKAYGKCQDGQANALEGACNNGNPCTPGGGNNPADDGCTNQVAQPGGGGGKLGETACFSSNNTRINCATSAPNSYVQTSSCSNLKGWMGVYTYYPICQGSTANYACAWQCKANMGGYIACSGNANQDVVQQAMYGLCDLSQGQNLRVSLTVQNLNEFDRYNGLTVKSISIALCTTDEACEWRDQNVPTSPYSSDPYTFYEDFPVNSSQTYKWVQASMRDSSDNLYRNFQLINLSGSSRFPSSGGYNLSISANSPY